MIRLFASILFLVWTAVATAQEGGELTDEEARSLYQAGAIAFEQGRFQNALDSFERAYKLSNRPELLFNIGVAADRLRLDARALVAFKRYLDLVPDGAEAPGVRARVAILEQTLAQQAKREQPQATPAEPTSPAQAAPRRPTPTVIEVKQPAASTAHGTTEEVFSALSWTLLGTGGASLASGVVLLIIGQARRGKIEDAEVESDWSSVAKYEDADTYTGVGITLLGVGAAAAGVGIALAFGADDEREPNVSVSIGPPVALFVRGRL